MNCRILAAILLILASASPWIDPSWQYRLPITMNNSGSALTDYQVAVNTANLVYNNSGLVGSWHFSEASGTKFVDSSGNGNDGTYNGETLNPGTLTNFNFNASSGWAQGRLGGALRSDGTDDYVSIPHSAAYNFGTGDFAIGFWMKANDTAAGIRYILSKMTSGTDYWTFNNNQGGTNKLSFLICNANSCTNNLLVSATTVNDNNWHHVLATRSGTTLKLYIDGNPEANSTSSSFSMNFAGAVEIGRMGSFGYAAVTIDDLRMYNRALTPSEIAQIYQNNTFLRSGLVGYWRFDEGSGTVAQDTHHIATQDNLNGTRFGNALSFDGVNDYVATGDLDLPAAFSISAWIAPGSLSGTPAIISKDDLASSRSYFLSFDNGGKLVGSVKDAGGSFTQYRTDSVALSAGQWQLVTMQYDGNAGAGQKIRFYINGTNLSASVIGGYDSGGTPADSTTSVKIGMMADGATWPFNGAIDEVRVYNRALSPAEIAALYTASKLRPDYQDLRFAQPYPVYETPITVSGTGADLADYQVFVSITNSAVLSHMNSTGSDLRFFAAQTPLPYSRTGLPYWIESINSTQANVWVKANVSSGGTTIYMYYGNLSAASASNGTNTFPFFDDFLGSGLSSTWTCGAVSPQYGTGSCVVSNSIVTLTGGTNTWWGMFASGAPLVTPPLSAEFRFKGNHMAGVETTGTINPAPKDAAFFDSTVSGYSSCNDNNCSSGGTLSPITSYSILRVDVYNGSVSYYVNGTLQYTKSTNVPTGDGMQLFMAAAQPSGIGYSDWAFVRKYASPEPSATVGTESVKSTPEALLNYWLENDSRAWVKVAGIPNGQSTIYAYYGNPNASSLSNVYSTLDYFNDFDSPLDSNFTTEAGGWSSGTGELVNNQPGSSENGKIQLNSKTFTNMSFDLKANHVSGDSSTPLIRFDGTWGNDWFGNSYRIALTASSTVLYKHTSASVDTQIGSTGPGMGSGWHEISLRAAGSTVQAYLDGNLVASGTDASYTSGRIGIITHSPAGAVQYKYDKWRVRKYAYPEPALSLQQEQAYSAPAVSLAISPSSKTTFPNYNETFALNVTNIQNTTDGFVLSCSGTCYYSENPVSMAANQTKSVNVTITSANASGTAQYTITATSQANASNYGSISASLTADTAKWRSTWSDAYGREFRYRVPLTITNGGNATLTDYQINVTLDTASLISASRIRGDCGDIRFTNGTNELPYFVDSACNNASTKIWTKVPYLPVGPSAVYLYYGSASATNASSGEATFDFFDDFGDGAIDGNRWNTAEASGAWTEGGGALNIYVPGPGDDRFIMSTSSYKCKNCAIKTRFKQTTGSMSVLARTAAINYCSSWNWPEPGYTFTARGGASRYASCGGTTLISDTQTVSPGTWYNLEGLLYENSLKSDFNDGTAISSATDGSPILSAERFGLFGYSPSGGATYNFDYFRVRKYNVPEPSILAGATQTKGYRVLVRRCGTAQPGANVTAYVSGNATVSCAADPDGVCLLEVGAGTYDLLFRFADNSTAWKNGTAFG